MESVLVEGGSVGVPCRRLSEDSARLYIIPRSNPMQRGESPTVIARILGVCRTSLYRWLAMAKQAPRPWPPSPIPDPSPG